MGDIGLRLLQVEKIPLKLEHMFHYMFDKEISTCLLCGRMFTTKKSARICPACRRRRRNERIAQRDRPVLCDCGQPAVIEVEVQVGEEGCYTLSMPLCADCYRLEQEMMGK
jgi:hypothetical protein